MLGTTNNQIWQVLTPWVEIQQTLSVWRDRLVPVVVYSASLHNAAVASDNMLYVLTKQDNQTIIIQRPSKRINKMQTASLSCVQAIMCCKPTEELWTKIKCSCFLHEYGETKIKKLSCFFLLWASAIVCRGKLNWQTWCYRGIQGRSQTYHELLFSIALSVSVQKFCSLFRSSYVGWLQVLCLNSFCSRIQMPPWPNSKHYSHA